MRLNRMCGDGGCFDLNGDGACSMGNYGGFQYAGGRPIGFVDNGKVTIRSDVKLHIKVQNGEYDGRLGVEINGETTYIDLSASGLASLMSSMGKELGVKNLPANIAAKLQGQIRGGKGQTSDKKLDENGKFFTGTTSDGKSYFEGVNLYLLDNFQGSAIALPGMGIFMDKSVNNKTELLRHEFGHILQAEIWGNDYFYTVIAPISVKSHIYSQKYPQFDHDDTWTEWTANNLSYNYFGRPKDWDMNFNPIFPSGKARYPFNPRQECPIKYQYFY